MSAKRDNVNSSTRTYGILVVGGERIEELKKMMINLLRLVSSFLASSVMGVYFVVSMVWGKREREKDG